MATAKGKAETHGHRREIVGISLLGLGVFSALSLVSMHAGSNRLMGPGGAAAAAALSSLAGFAACLIVAVRLGVAVRCFRGRLVRRGAGDARGGGGHVSRGGGAGGAGPDEWRRRLRR